MTTAASQFCLLVAVAVPLTMAARAIVAAATDPQRNRPVDVWAGDSE